MAVVSYTSRSGDKMKAQVSRSAVLLRLRRARRKHGIGKAAFRMARAVARQLGSYAAQAALRRQNAMSERGVTGDADAVVSLTTYGRRIGSVYLTIESIARGSVLPKRLILWLDDTAVVADPPLELRRLMRRGLEILASEDLGAHKKYFPALEHAITDNVSRLITADDDVLYPTWWLKKLMNVCDASPSAIVAYRARRVLLKDDGFAPWVSWPLCDSQAPSCMHFAIGEAGVAYPPSVLRALRVRGREFLKTAPRVDDIWLHSTATEISVPTRQVSAKSLHPLVVPGSQVVALGDSNIDGGGNDHALRVNYSSKAMARLRAASGSRETT